MKHLLLVLVSTICFCNAQEIPYTFADDFLFGVATASYQVEGAWNESGKGENIWDRLVHTRSELIEDGSDGDVASDTYHHTADDIQLLKDLGVDFYRFSLSWARLLPTGQVNNINADGVRYYNELIDGLVDANIIPMVTIYHWDLPQALQEIGGWPSPRMADYFVEYADFVFETFGDRVTEWITFNEFSNVCEAGYSHTAKAPAYSQAGIGGYLCTHTALIAHGRAYRLYYEKYQEIQQGRVGIAIDTSWNEPASTSAEDVEIAERMLQMNYGWYVHPILTGDYPPVLRERVDAVSAEEGFSRSRLPYFTEEQIEILKGSADFLGLNHYTTTLCTPKPDDMEFEKPSHAEDIGAHCYYDDSWPESASSWLKIVPWGFRKLLNWIKGEYGNPEVIITENGYSDWGELNDCRRIYYYNAYLEQLLLAINEDGCFITGYGAWSFMDNYEWFEGYTSKFGLYSVDFEDDERPRTPKMSSYIYKDIIANKAVNWDYVPDGFEACNFEEITGETD